MTLLPRPWLQAIGAVACLVVVFAATRPAARELASSQERASGAPANVVQSRQSGAWSDPATWEGQQPPTAGSRVYIRQGHTILYDVDSDRAIRSLVVSGVLRFATNVNTRLDAGLIRISANPGVLDDETIDCHVHAAAGGDGSEPALVVGTSDLPIDPDRTATIRLVHFAGMNAEALPAIVACGGRVDIHGAPLARTWVKLGATVRAGDTRVALAEPVPGWRAGDRVILTATQRENVPPARLKSATMRPGAANRKAFTEERLIKVVSGRDVILDAPVDYEHSVDGAFAGEMANLSRNVVVESAKPDGVRGHTMFHAGTVAAIAYAEFRHLGKEGVLARYPIHFHLAGSSARGSSVVGASIWDSHNRWITIHATNYVVVRDTVGYQSIGHGFFLEDGTEVYNVFDRNLAVQAFRGKPLPKQALAFDDNSGAGFWWTNSRNTFTRNTTVENDQYGYRFDAPVGEQFALVLPILQPDGETKNVDVRSIPFVRFDDNEAHSEGAYGINFRGVEGSAPREQYGPDIQHPFVVRRMLVWNVHFGFRPESRNLLLEDVAIVNSNVGIYEPTGSGQVYRRLVTRNVRRNDLDRAAPTAASTFSTLIDDTPPATVVTEVARVAGALIVRGTTSDNGDVRRVFVNGQEARLVRPNFAEWEVSIPFSRPGPLQLSAWAEDEAGNIERMRHELVVRIN